MRRLTASEFMNKAIELRKRSEPSEKSNVMIEKAVRRYVYMLKIENNMLEGDC